LALGSNGKGAVSPHTLLRALAKPGPPRQIRGMTGLTAWLRRLAGAPAPHRLDDSLWQRALRRPAWTRVLDDSARTTLRELTERFLGDKAVTPAAGFSLTEDRRVLIAMLCCQPVLRLGYDWLRGWHEVIVYPGRFRVRRHDYDEDTGVLQEWDDDLAGEAWDRGPLILSWADVRADLDAPEPGYHVVAHEIAHKLDALDGAIDGMPPLPAAMRGPWARDFQSAYDALCADLEAGRETAIDAYAGEAPEEFFAVCTEYWFTAPQVLRARMPAVAKHLEDFYGAA
jgi:Mlc titration factor MtfA (ptsG expression regulator)